MGYDTDGSREVDAYIAAQPEAVRPLLDAVRATLRTAAPEAEEKLSYGIPTFYQGGNLVGFGVAKQHLGLYPTPSAIVAFGAELAPYAHSKGAVQFPFDSPLPHDLIARIVQFRVAQNVERATAKRVKKAKPAAKE